jgi:photosystem II stability/assembly factor-like uncharacterized protein
VVYAGTERGVYKTTDGGDHWVQSTGLITLFFIDTLAVDPVTPSTVYAGGNSHHAGGGVFKSDDAGLNWRPVNSGLTNEQIIGVIIDPENHAIVYANDEINLFKSTDAGNTWVSSLSYPSPGDNVFDSQLRIDPFDSSTLYVTGNGHFYKTTDGGISWIDLTNRVIEASTAKAFITLIVDPIHSGVIYLQGGPTGLVKTTDGGNTWKPATDDNSRRMFNLVAYSLAPSVLYASDGLSLFKSTDQGNTWIATGLPRSGNRLFALDPVDPSILYWAVSGGTPPTDTPWINGFSIDGKRLSVIGVYFDEGAAILLDGEEQPTKNDKQSPGDILIGKKAGKRVSKNPDTKIQVRNSNGKLSQEVTIWPPID